MRKIFSLPAVLLFVAVAVAFAGSTPGSANQAVVCGGLKGAACSEGQFCDLPAGQCKVADLQGTCAEKPAACTKEYRAVCGCDGKTYGNDCTRQMAGVQKDHDGECAKP